MTIWLKDEAIQIVNSSQKNKGGKFFISNFRSFMNLEEDYHEDDFELYDDYDYSSLELDYVWWWVSVEKNKRLFHWRNSSKYIYILQLLSYTSVTSNHNCFKR